MDVLIFDIIGKMAHFRKFYTNSSSLSYSVPPRTAVAGLICAVLGIERDAYYEAFSTEKCSIALRKLNKTRRIMQSLNYIKTDSTGNLYNIKNHTQVPFEIIAGYEDDIKYRVYISHKDTEILNNIENRIKNKKYFYAPYLGAASFNCSLIYVNRTIGQVKKDEAYISSLIDCEKIRNINIDFSNEKLFIMKEKMPCDFNKDRKIIRLTSYIYDENCSAIKAAVKESYTALKYNGCKENIIFM